MTVAAAIARAVAARAAGNAAPTDADRILALPVEPESDGEGEARALTAMLATGPTSRPLRPVQGRVLAALLRASLSGSARGVFGAVGVGHGKTLISLLAGEVVGAARPLLLIPPTMREQLAVDAAEWALEYRFTPPRVLAYSELSQAKATAALDYYAPDLLIADEAHALRHLTSARAKRVFRYLATRPDCRCLFLSGTITGRSLLDHAHLLEASLREFAPIPSSRSALEQWASVVDADGEPDRNAVAALWPLAVAAGAPSSFGGVPVDRRRELAREGYRSRLVTVPGVVTTPALSAACSLDLVALPRPKPPRPVVDALCGVVGRWELPDPSAVVGEHGEELVDAAGQARAASALSAGFYYRWAWSDGHPTEEDREWLERRRVYAKAVRSALFGAREGYDSPLLVGAAASRGEGPAAVVAAWRAWHATSPTGEPWAHREPPPTVAVWVSRYLLDDVVARVAAARGEVAKVPPGERAAAGLLVWYTSRAVEEALAAAGVPTFGAGSPAPDPVAAPVCALSIRVHGTGKNLQAWRRSLVVEPPPSGTTWDQLIGRTHRQGQAADVVEVATYQNTDRTRDAVARATEQAHYIAQTQGTAQRLLLGRWRVE